MENNEAIVVNESSKEVAINDFSYLKEAASVNDYMEEMDELVKDLNKAAFTATFDVVAGVKLGYEAFLTVTEALIDTYEEKSPDPENDEFITKLYNVYEAVEQLKNKCEYL